MEAARLGSVGAVRLLLANKGDPVVSVMLSLSHILRTEVTQCAEQSFAAVCSGEWSCSHYSRAPSC